MRLNKKHLRKYNGEIERIGELSIGEDIRKMHLRKRNTFDYELSIVTIDQK